GQQGRLWPLPVEERVLTEHGAQALALGFAPADQARRGLGHGLRAAVQRQAWAGGSGVLPVLTPEAAGDEGARRGGEEAAAGGMAVRFHDGTPVRCWEAVTAPPGAGGVHSPPAAPGAVVGPRATP